MGRELYRTQPDFRRTLDRCAEILAPTLARPLLDVIFPDRRAATPLDETAFTQPALFAVEYALAQLWMAWGVEPVALLGHSVGEYVAACVAGVFTLEDALTVIAARGRLMQALHADGSMVEKPQLAANTRRMVKAIVGGIMQQAVLHQAVSSNPVRDLERIESPKGHRKAPPRGLTAEERRRLLAFVDTDQTAIRADLPGLIRFALGSGLRVGEICAVRWMDLDLDGLPVVSETDMRLVPVVAVRQNVYPVKGKGLVVHGGKTSTALRIVPLPKFVVTQLRARQHGDDDPTWPVFASAGRDGQPTYRWPSNVRRSVRTVREKVGLNWMTPHTWRRTYATILDDEMSLTDRAKADLMGQAKFLKDTYVSRGELHPDAAVYLDAALR